MPRLVKREQDIKVGRKASIQSYHNRVEAQKAVQKV